MNTSWTDDSSWATLDAEPPSGCEVRRDIVAIGASTGGLSAICKLLSSLPDAFNSAILIALDMGSQPAASILQVLSCYCRLPLSYAIDGGLVRRNCVLVAPWGHHMRVTTPGIIRLEEESSFSRTSPCANQLFKSCAVTYGQRVIGMVLSGGSHDGTAGLKCIETAGGIGMVQRSEEAGDPRMPVHALRHAHPVYCGGVDAMGLLLIAMASGMGWSEALSRSSATTVAAAAESDDQDQVTTDSSLNTPRRVARHTAGCCTDGARRHSCVNF